MADKTKIEWTEATWNPIRARLRADPSVIGWHCEHASPGCEHCYSETRNLSGRCNLGTRLPFKPGHRKDVEVYLDEKVLLQPLRWRRGRQIFVCSMTDLFADFVTDEMFDRVFAVMALCPQHTFQVLTKRSARMRGYFADRSTAERIIRGCETIKPSSLWNGNVYQATTNLALRDPLPNVWLGVSVEDQQRADERIPDLLATPAAVRWLSCEPLLGPVDIHRWLVCDFCAGEHLPDEIRRKRPIAREIARCGNPRLDWIVAGGESGKAARPMHPVWARSLRDQCAAAEVPFFFKQWGEHADADAWMLNAGVDADYDAGTNTVRVGKKRAGRLLDGALHDGMPAHG